jgi:hypothetical protein
MAPRCCSCKRNDSCMGKANREWKTLGYKWLTPRGDRPAMDNEEQAALGSTSPSLYGAPSGRLHGPDGCRSTGAIRRRDRASRRVCSAKASARVWMRGRRAGQSPFKGQIQPLHLPDPFPCNWRTNSTEPFSNRGTLHSDPSLETFPLSFRLSLHG